nr:sterol desaturase-like protein [Tanacetum cinerariifolium]
MRDEDVVQIGTEEEVIAAEICDDIGDEIVVDIENEDPSCGSDSNSEPDQENQMYMSDDSESEESLKSFDYLKEVKGSDNDQNNSFDDEEKIVNVNHFKECLMYYALENGFSLWYDRSSKEKGVETASQLLMTVSEDPRDDVKISGDGVRVADLEETQRRFAG